jgi:hypothetical protein
VRRRRTAIDLPDTLTVPLLPFGPRSGQFDLFWQYY